MVVHRYPESRTAGVSQGHFSTSSGAVETKFRRMIFQIITEHGPETEIVHASSCWLRCSDGTIISSPSATSDCRTEKRLFAFPLHPPHRKPTCGRDSSSILLMKRRNWSFGNGEPVRGAANRNLACNFGGLAMS
jgi:hypothetical protein